MLQSKEAQIPNNLISLAKKTPNLSAGIICANHDSSMESAKKSVELNLIKPIRSSSLMKLSKSSSKF